MYMYCTIVATPKTQFYNPQRAMKMSAVSVFLMHEWDCMSNKFTQTYCCIHNSQRIKKTMIGHELWGEHHPYLFCFETQWIASLSILLPGFRAVICDEKYPLTLKNVRRESISCTCIQDVFSKVQHTMWFHQTEMSE